MDGSTDSPTLTSSTPTPTAAPAISAPSSSESASPRPTMAEAFAADAAPDPTSDASPEGAATTAPDATQAGTSAQGPIPFDVHKTALENARTKAVAQAQAEFEQQYGWAKSVDRTAVSEAQRLGQMYQQDRPGYIREVLREAMSDADLAPLVRSEAARVLGSRQQQAPQADSMEPDIPVMDAAGNVVAQTFSAGKVQQIVQRAIEDAIGREISPIKQDFQQRQQQAQQAKVEQEISTAATGYYDTAISELPHFKEHEAEIAKAMESIPGDPGQALHRAWAKVVLPKLQATHQSQALDSLKTKAAASTSVNPASAVVASTHRPRSLTDASLQW